jgi:hypothetical protein
MIVGLQLSKEQERLLAPIVREASAKRANVVFLASVAPDNGAWWLQATVIPARVGSKILQILKKEVVGHAE